MQQLTVSPPLSADLAPTITAAEHVAGKAIGERLTIAVPTGGYLSGPKGPIAMIQSFVLTCKDKIAGRVGLALFNVSFVDVGDNAVFAPTHLEMLNYVGSLRVESSHWEAFSLNEGATRSAYGFACKIIDGNLYGQFYAIGDVTFATADALKGKIAGIVT